MTTTPALRYLQQKTSTSQRLGWKLDAVIDTTTKLNRASLPTSDLLRLLRRQRDQANDALDLGILLSRNRGLSWSRISDTIGLPAQALEQRMRRLTAQLDATPEPN